MPRQKIIRYPYTSYRMPAEWELHEATWLAWPHNPEDWPGKFAPIPWVYTDIIRNLTLVERVRLLVRSKTEQEEALKACELAGANLDMIDIFEIPTNRIWLRDSGPIFVRNAEGKKLMLDWSFNAWAKYPDHKFDDKVPSAINEHFKFERIQPMHKGKRVVLEGGAIDVNGAGTLIATEECLLSDVQERNPGFTREDYEEIFARYLGISKVIWLAHGIVGDDTHGHIDDATRFVGTNTIVTCVEHDTKDDNYLLLKDNLKRLRAARDARGRPFNIVQLPMPRPVIFEGQRLPASYANFLIANAMVLVPTFNDPADRIALNILAECFPRHEIIPIHSLDLVWGLGTIHCMSQQEPA